MLGTLIQDTRLAVRRLANERGFTFIATAVLALGICGVTTQFSLVNAFLLHGVPSDEPEQLVSVALRNPSWPTERTAAPSSADFMEWTRHQATFVGLAACYTAGSFIVVRNGAAERMNGGHITPQFFTLLRVTPMLGREFTDADNQPNVERTTILSYAMWQADFGGDPLVLGRTLRVNGKPATVVGVMPQAFQFTRDRLWIPIYNEYAPGARHGTGNTRVFGRLKPGVSIERATDDIARVAASLADQFPDSNRTLTQIRIEPLLNRFVDRETRGLLLMMLAAVAAVLAIACINVTNLQLGRAIAHARHLAVQTALGASRSRLMAQIVTECLVIVTVGGAAGVVASLWTTALLERLVGEAALSGAIQPPPWLTFDVNGPVLGFSLAAAAASVVMAGVVPALFASRTNPTDVLRDGSRSHTGRFVNRLSAWLVTAQIALTCALLVASLLLVRTIVNRQRQSLGYDGTAVMTARMNLETDYHTEKELRDVFPALLESLRSTPGVTHAALTSRRSPIDVNVSELEIEGRAAAASPNDLPRASFEIVSDGYFAAIGLQPLRGREFTTADGPEDPVAIVNEPFARKYFAGSDAIGHRIRGNPGMPWVRIVGVVPETLMQGPLDSGESDGAGVFLPVSTVTQSYVSVVARGHGAPEQFFEPLRRAVAKVNPNVALYAPTTPAKSFAQALLASRVTAGMFTVFAWVALVLATLGLYGVVSFAVNQRMHEFGIRTALGASASSLIALVLRQGAAQFVVGNVIGLGITLWLVRLGGPILLSFLFRVDPHDPVVITTAIATIGIATLVACLVPARHAAKTDPLLVLRAE